MAGSFDELVTAAAEASVEGWDFSWLDGRAMEERPSWGYQRLLVPRLAAAHAALDLQTGGGEVLTGAGTDNFPATMVVTEGWPPNAERASELLGPFGVVVVAHDGASPLPFADGSFDLVTSRHPATVQWDEITRVLTEGGTYFAQHVGGASNVEISEFFLGPFEPGTTRDHEVEAAAATAAGLEVVECRNERLGLEFYDVGAMIYFLRKVIWTVPGFTIDGYRARLADMHRLIERDGVFRSTMSRTLIEARKPAKDERAADEIPLTGGNLNLDIVRVGDTVRRTAGPWTPAVHDLLRHLGQVGYPAPEPLGFDDAGREVLSFIDGVAADPDRLDALATRAGVERAGRLIDDYHRAQAGFAAPVDAQWQDLGRDPTGSEEVLAHNDLSPWNLIIGPQWVFIDWDLVAPGRRFWDLAWALHSLVGLWPDSPFDELETAARISAFCDEARVEPNSRRALLEVVVERTAHNASGIRRRAADGDPAYVLMLDLGHAERWEQGCDHVQLQSDRWVWLMDRAHR